MAYNKTTYEFFQGKAKWVKHHRPNQWGKWAMTLYPNAQSLDRIRELQAEGIKNTLRKDEDGYYINIGRPVQITAKGKVVGMTPPVVYLKDWETPLPQDQLVGNGSDVTVKCECYGGTSPVGTKYKAIRWQALRVDNLVPYERERDQDHYEAHLTKGLDEQPSQPLF